jgi:hypothetical protein
MIISEENYTLMKKYIAEYENKESNTDTEEKPYIETLGLKIKLQYNPKYGDHRECNCGHPYHRHFDSYEEMSVVGCKYCGCFIFQEA